ncbi:MAG: hypothetical protein M0023_04395 [Desulfobacteraceae bacterium]|nr:hypothetical protein [Desulfobacteraceae bacterium]
MTPDYPDYPKWKLVLDLIQMLGTVAVAIYVWWSNREKVTSQRFSALEKEVAERLKKTDLDEAKIARDLHCSDHKNETKALSKAYADLHIEVTRLPDRREITNLDNTMKQLAEKLGNLDGRMSGMNRAVDLINEFLIDQGGKK